MIQKSDLTPGFRHIRLNLAREKDHPVGSTEEGYDILAPLDPEGRIDAAEWKRHQAHCRVRHFRSGHDDMIGRLRRKPGGQWYVDYEPGEADDEAGFRFEDERFVTGEYVSLGRAGEMHTFQVMRVAKP